MRELNHFETLVLYDGLQVFIADDQFGAKFICMLVEEGPQSDKYLCAPVSLLRYQQFLDGNLDLREIFDHPETDELFHIEAGPEKFREMPATRMVLAQVPSK